VSPQKPGANRRTTWTSRKDAEGNLLGNRTVYLTGVMAAELDQGAREAGFVFVKTVKGQPVEVVDLQGYIMSLHHAAKGITPK